MIKKDYVYFKRANQSFVLPINFENGLKVTFQSVWWSSIKFTTDVIQTGTDTTIFLDTAETTDFDGVFTYEVYRELTNDEREILQYGRLYEKDT